jgi:large subunit ribosomal protein L25
MLSCEVGDSVHLSDLKLPAGVESVELSHGPEHDLPVATVLAPKGGVAEETAS